MPFSHSIHTKTKLHNYVTHFLGVRDVHVSVHFKPTRPADQSFQQQKGRMHEDNVLTRASCALCCEIICQESFWAARGSPSCIAKDSATNPTWSVVLPLFTSWHSHLWPRPWSTSNSWTGTILKMWNYPNVGTAQYRRGRDQTHKGSLKRHNTTPPS